MEDYHGRGRAVLRICCAIFMVAALGVYYNHDVNTKCLHMESFKYIELSFNFVLIIIFVS